uniref:Stromal interaction molecule 2 n=1 Tax=Hippocampus comes TaxID=109280 RepID=A0A3Q2XV80_HIPCM
MTLGRIQFSLSALHGQLLPLNPRPQLSAGKPRLTPSCHTKLACQRLSACSTSPRLPSQPAGSPGPTRIWSTSCQGCLDADRFSLVALRHIHKELDDDNDGGIEVNESVEFIIEDMKQQQTNKHSNLHREDQHITVEELWKGWKTSEVHNWTVEDTVQWLKESVELPQYEKNFRDFRVTGNTLPRIAANEPSFLSMQLKVSDQRHKQKLNLKALDAVLFGPPLRPHHNWMKDFVLTISIVIGVGGCWFAYVQNKSSKVHMSQMMRDLESLQNAEQSLLDLQSRLEKAQEENRTVIVEKQNLEQKMRDEITGAKKEAHRLRDLREGAECELSRLKYAEEELVQVKPYTRQKVAAAHARASSGPFFLYKYFLFGFQAEKIKKKRSSVFGTLHVAHSSSLDEVDHKILEAKKSLSEVTACLRERLHRWQQIERLCGFPVVMPRVSVPPYPIAGGVDDLDEDTPPIVPQFTGESFVGNGNRNLGAVYAELLQRENHRLTCDAVVSSSMSPSDQEVSPDTDAPNSSMGRKPPHSYRKISREEMLLFNQSPEFPTPTSNSGDSTPPPPLPPTPAASPSGPPSTSPSPDLTRVAPDLRAVTPPSGKAAYNGVLEKSHSFGVLPAVGRYPSLTSLDSEGRSVGREHKLLSTSSQDSSDNGEKIKRSSSKIKSLFKKKK